MTKQSFALCIARIREYKRRIEFYASEVEAIVVELETRMEWTEPKDDEK